MELKLSKRHAKGGGTYVNPQTRARVQVSRKFFVDGNAPETVEFDAENIAPPSEKDLAKVKRAEEKLAKMANLPEKIAKAEEKLAKLKKAMESQPAVTESEQVSA